MPDHSEKKGQVKQSAEQTDNSRLSRRNMLLGTSTLVAAATMASGALAQAQKTAPNAAPAPSGRKPNILVIFGDDIGQTNVSAYSFGLMGYRTPNIDRIAKEGMMFTDYYAEQSCTAGRSSFITGQCTLRTGLSKVGIPGATVGLQARDATIAELLKPLGYATGQFGKNHLGDRNEYLPTVHGFDEFFGNLYHLNAEEDPENRFYPTDPAVRQAIGPRGVLRCKASDRDDPTEHPRWGKVGKQTIEDTARSQKNAWRRSTTKPRPPPSISCNDRRRPTHHSSAGSIPHGCISAPMCAHPIAARRD
jgi:arylsulfatase